MNKVKITVLETTLDKELVQECRAEGFTVCSMIKEGQIFYMDYAKSERFYDGTWIAVHSYIFSLVHGTGSEPFCYGNWIRKSGVAIYSRDDGLRPVVFKVESAGQDSAMEYEPA